VEKYGRLRQTTDDNMAHVRCLMGTKVYKYTLTICNIYFFLTATMVIHKRALILRFYVHYRSRLFEVCYVCKISELRKGADFVSLCKTLRNNNLV
jgi:hypothetical protein